MSQWVLSTRWPGSAEAFARLGGGMVLGGVVAAKSSRELLVGGMPHG
jgi:hypothetical protein